MQLAVGTNKKKNDESTIRCSVTLPAEHWRAIKRVSDEKRLGMSWLIAKLVRTWFEAEKPEEL